MEFLEFKYFLKKEKRNRINKISANSIHSCMNDTICFLN